MTSTMSDTSKTLLDYFKGPYELSIARMFLEMLMRNKIDMFSVDLRNPTEIKMGINKIKETTNGDEGIQPSVGTEGSESQG